MAISKEMVDLEKTIMQREYEMKMQAVAAAAAMGEKGRPDSFEELAMDELEQLQQRYGRVDIHRSGTNGEVCVRAGNVATFARSAARAIRDLYQMDVNRVTNKIVGADTAPGPYITSAQAAPKV